MIDGHMTLSHNPKGKSGFIWAAFAVDGCMVFSLLRNKYSGRELLLETSICYIIYEYMAYKWAFHSIQHYNI
jgi:hypothetical protein